MNRFEKLLLAALTSIGGFPVPGTSASCADLAIVLAIDGSGSINDRDFLLQQAGYATAFADPRVRAALASAGVVDVAVVLWGDEEIAPQVLPWQRLESSAGADALSRKIAAMPRRVTGDTGIGSGLWAALDLLEDDQPCAARRIVNVSGDGKESFGARPRHHVPLAIARKRAETMKVTINGLAITVDSFDLEAWYRDRVILGPEAFVMSVARFDDFAEAIARKLSREIALPMLATLPIQYRSQP